MGAEHATSGGSDSALISRWLVPVWNAVAVDSVLLPWLNVAVPFSTWMLPYRYQS